MSFLGVGAPEAILVAIVALVVFGPKGLADVSNDLGRGSGCMRRLANGRGSWAGNESVGLARMVAH